MAMAGCGPGPRTRYVQGRPGAISGHGSATLPDPGNPRPTQDETIAPQAKMHPT